MPWFESSQDKRYRTYIQQKMKICLTKPDKYEQGKNLLTIQVTKSNQKAIEMIVDHIKQVIKDDDIEIVQKLRAITLLRDLMDTQNKALGKYVVKKILKRLTIFAEHRKNEKDQNRGANIFKCKKSQQKYGIQFLKTLLLALQSWGKNWPKQVDGPFHDFQSAYNDLLMQKQVTFPIDNKRGNKSLSPTPLANPNRNSREQFNSPPKLNNPTIMRGKLENPPSKPNIKERTLLKGEAAQYVNQMIEMLNLLATTLSQNPRFGQIWGIIKAYIDQLKAIDQKGNFLVASMIEKGQQNPQLFQAIQTNSTFLADIQKDAKIVDGKSINYEKFHPKYIKKCKKLAVSLSIFVEESGPSQSNTNNLSGANNKPGVQTSINQKVEQVRAVEKPKAVQQINRYGSSAALRNQLQINLQPIKKEDFNSNTHKFNQNSESSSRYNSVSGNIPGDRNRNSQNQFSISADVKQKQVLQQPNNINRTNSQTFKINEQKKQIQNIGKRKPQNLKQISKITQKKQDDSENNINKFDFENDVPKQKQQNNINGSFGDFEVSGEKHPKQDSDSNFFKQLDIKQEGIKQAAMRRGRKPGNKAKIQQDQNFFDVSIKNKQQSQNLSGFNKSKSNSQEATKKEMIQSGQVSKPGLEFDTFKNQNQLAKGLQQLRKSQKSQKSEKSYVSNPFGEKQINSSFNRIQNFEDNPFATVVPVANQNNQNPFETDQPRKSNNQNVNQFTTSDNPFVSKIQNLGNGVFSNKQKSDDENKSKSSNPFSSKHSQSNHSFQRNSIRQRPPLQKKKSQILNPFDNKSQRSNNQGRSDNPFEDPIKSNIDNPFESKYNKNSSDKSLSQRGSFVDTKNVQKIINKNTNSIDDPFQNQFSKQNSDKQKGKKQSLKNIDSKQSQLDVKQRSFQGFDFDDFMNASQQKSQDSSVKNQNKNQSGEQKHNQSGFNLSKFPNVNNQQSKSNYSDFFFNQPINNIQNAPKQKENSFDFFQSNNRKKQPSAQRDFFETSSKSLGKDKPPIQKQQSKGQLGQNSFDKLQFGFQDFQNVSKSSHQKSSSRNPFSQFQQSKNNIQSANIVKKPNIKEEVSRKQSDEWDKFDNIKQKWNQLQLNEKQKIQESKYEPSEQKSEQQNRKRMDTPWFNEFKRKPTQESQDIFVSNQKKYTQKQQNINEQKSISIHFEQISPFQKKQIPWDYTLAPLPSSARYNITATDLNEKKLALSKLEANHESRLSKYRQLNQKLNELKKIYSGCINKVGEAREQKKQFGIILKRLQETNQIKQKQIQQLIKKTKKTEELKRKILESERMLYERMKNQKYTRQLSASNKQKTGNKWDRFNQNLRRQRQDLQFERTLSNYTYYA